jgi:hypothetical protein
MSEALRLQPEPVPRLLWGISAQELLGSAWKRCIRPQALDEAQDSRCLRCGALGNLDVHEQWEYDDAESVATVVGLIPICKDCHAVVHIDQVPANYFDRALRHLAAVNGITLGEAQALVDDAYAACERRPVFVPWRVEISSHVVERYPDMALLPERALAKIGPLVEVVRRLHREP